MLREKIDQDLAAALKATKTAPEESAARVSALRLLKAAVMNAEIAKSKKGAFDDSEIENVIRSEVKKLRDALSDFEKAGRADLISKTKGELSVLESYLPAGASADEVRAAVKKVIAESGAAGVKDFGKVMGAAMKALGGRADGSVVSGIVKEELSE